MTTPGRIQRRRTKGWRKPAGAVIVDRTSQWGNPYRIGDPHPLTGEVITDRAAAVDAFRRANGTRPAWLAEARRELGGKDLVCWCPPDGPCHADVLLELANPDPMGEE